MVLVEVDEKTHIATVSPTGSLTENDFETIRNIIDPYLEKHGVLTGIIIQSRDFPGWESFKDFVSHLKFIKSYHKQIKRVAIVSNSNVASLAKSLGKHFVAAEVRNFAFDNLKDAKNWISTPQVETSPS